METQKSMKVIQVEDFSKPLRVTELPIPKISPNQVLIKELYSPINPADLLSARGNFFGAANMPTPFIAGSEASGEVVQVGKDYESKFKPGDKVFYLTNGTWCEYAAVDGESVYKLPEGAPIDVASCSFINPMTVYCMLLELQNEGHKSVVSTVGSSSLGRMLIKVMKEAGIKTINLVRNADYIQELKEIGADYVLNTKDENFEKEFKKITNSLGCRKAFDAISGDFTGKLVWLMPKKSSISVYGALGDMKAHIEFWALLSQASTVTGFWLLEKMGDHSKETIDQGFQKIFAGLRGTFESQIQKVFKFDDIDEAIKFSEEHGSKGKVLLSPSGN